MKHTILIVGRILGINLNLYLCFNFSVWHAQLQKCMPYVTDSSNDRIEKLKELKPLIRQLEEHSINLAKSKLFDQCMQHKQRLLHTPLSGAANDTFVAQYIFIRCLEFK